MTTEERAAIITEALVEHGLKGYTPPRGLSEDDQISVVQRIVASLDRKMPPMDETKLRETLSLTFAAVHDAHEGYAWPTQSEFAKGLPIYGMRSTRAPETFDTKKESGLISAINEGRAVSEKDLWSPTMDRLPVDQSTVDKYRFASIKGYVETYKQDAEKIATRNIGLQVSRYFQGANQ